MKVMPTLSPAADARPGRVLMVGTALEGRGGIAAVVSVLRDGGLFEREGVRYLSTHSDGSAPHKAKRALAGLLHAARVCLWQRPAIVHVHAASRASFLRKSLVLLLARCAGCKTIFHLHGGGFREFATVESGAVMRRWIRHTLEHSSLVIALSGNWAKFLRGFAPDARVAVVPNPVPLPPRASSDGQPGRILFLGRVEPAKGVHELLAACALLAPRHAGLRLVIAGEGDLDGARRAAAALGIGEHVELPGWLGPERRAAELQAACLFCLPSHAEGLPMALLEAMAVGKAVVATEVGGIPELIGDNDNGVLVPPHDSNALAAALATLLDDASLRQRLGARARATVERHYSLAAVSARLGEIYQELEGAR